MEMHSEDFYKRMFTKEELDFIRENDICISKIDLWAERKRMFGHDFSFEMSEKYSDYLANIRAYKEMTDNEKAN